MAINRALRKAVREKLGISSQALSNRVQRRKKGLTMTNEEATYLIAHESGIRIDKYLSPEQVAAVRHLQTQANQSSTNLPRQRRPSATKGKSTREIRFPAEFKSSDPILPTRKLNEAVAMAKIYPLLYVLENSMRELIRRVMQSKFGEDWWDTQLTSSKLRTVNGRAAERMKTESTKHAWHQRRGDHPIDYVQIEDLESIIRGKYSLFEDIISDREWFVQFMKELKPSRNVVCHMNPLDSDNIRDIQVKFRRWEKVVRNALDHIPD